MKILDTPRSGKCGQTVAFRSRFGLSLRQYVPQKAALTPARRHVCAVFGSKFRKWGAKLSGEQQDRWILAGAQVMSQPRFAQKWAIRCSQWKRPPHSWSSDGSALGSRAHNDQPSRSPGGYYFVKT
jgi:hypothetical protein